MDLIQPAAYFEHGFLDPDRYLVVEHLWVELLAVTAMRVIAHPRHHHLKEKVLALRLLLVGAS